MKPTTVAGGKNDGIGRGGKRACVQGVGALRRIAKAILAECHPN